MLSWWRQLRRHQITLAVTALLAVAVMVFSSWLVVRFLAIIRFRDSVIDRQYEGSLSTHLGFLVALTSEAARSGALSSDAHERQQEELESELLAIRNRLSNLTLLQGGTAARREPVGLEVGTDERALLQLLADPRLAEMSLSDLGLDLVTKEDLPGYPFIRSTQREGSARSFVFFPAPSVDVDSTPRALSLRRRKELLFSRIVALQLEALLGRVDQLQITQSYFIGCSDFIHLVSPSPLSEPDFGTLRSFVDRTYFTETRKASGVRESEPYLDVTGGGFVRTYSVFVDNRSLGICGMVAVDCRLQTLADFWQNVELGTRGGDLRDFTFANYSLASRHIEPQDVLPAAVRTEIEDDLASWNNEKLTEGIQGFTVGSSKVFTVPMGAYSTVPMGSHSGDDDVIVGLFVFDAQAMRRKYYLILAVGLVLIVGFVCMVAFTAGGHRAAAAAERLQEEVLENLHGGFVIVDRQGTILGSTGRFRQMVGEDRAEGMIDRFLTPASAAEYRKLASGGSFEFAGNLHADQGSTPVIIASAPISLSGKLDPRMLILIPSAELEQTIAKKFLNIFSHALKSPVHSILLIADLFRRRNALPRFNEYYSKLFRKVQEFRILTDNVLRFSAYDVKAIQVEKVPVNVAQVLRQVLADARERAKFQGLTFDDSIPGSLQLLGDAHLLQVVVNNLVDNGLKYTPEGQVVVRAVDLLTRIEIVVEDSGPGVPENEREKIFELFVQGSEATRKAQEGLGLGLYISRLYVEAMGGSLRYEPILREQSGGDGAPKVKMTGSRFIVEFQLPPGRTTDGREVESAAG
jgi:signal transduction histidine kinase